VATQLASHVRATDSVFGWPDGVVDDHVADDRLSDSRVGDNRVVDSRVSDNRVVEVAAADRVSDWRLNGVGRLDRVGDNRIESPRGTPLGGPRKNVVRTTYEQCNSGLRKDPSTIGAGSTVAVSGVRSALAVSEVRADAAARALVASQARVDELVLQLARRGRRFA
jgi:hypothetical protein